MSSVVVLGAGLQGAGVALELARRGCAVTLVDQDERVFNRTSLRNEGKLHLGFVYANDPSRATARTLLRAALGFRSILDSWTSARFSRRVRRSNPFHYLISTESMISPERIIEHYRWVQDEYSAVLAEQRAVDYLGRRPRTLYRELSRREWAAQWSAAGSVAAVSTQEVAVNLSDLAKVVRRSISESPMVDFRPCRVVREVERSDSGFVVRGDSPNGAWSLRGTQVVNALWAGRRAIDDSVGVTDGDVYANRLRYRVVFRAQQHVSALPSATLTLGAFGDVVVYTNGWVYASWYADALAGWSTELTCPTEWDAACVGAISPSERAEIRHRILGASARWYPALPPSNDAIVDAGIIHGLGSSDITDPGSQLHRRDTAGVRSWDGYHSVNTGKLTTAPLHAVEAADAVLARR